METQNTLNVLNPYPNGTKLTRIPSTSKDAPKSPNPLLKKKPSESSKKLNRPKVVLPLVVFFNLFLLLILLTLGFITWHLTLQGGQTAAFTFAQGLQSELLDHAITTIENHIVTAEKLSKIQQYNWRHGIFRMNDKRSVLTKLFPQLSFNVENVITQTFTTNAGELWGFYTYLERRNDYKSRKYSMWEHYGLNYTEYDVDKELNILNINYQSNQLNYTDGTWVLMVNKSNEADIAWSTVYVWQEIAWLTNSVPIYDNSSECIGVCSTDMDLHFINSILSARIRSVKQPTVLYVIESSAEFVIGTSHDNTDMFYRDPILNISTRPFTAREKSNIEIGSFDTLIKSKGFNFTTLPDDYSDTCFDVKSNTYFYVTTKKIKWRNFEWTVVQFLERSSVYITINKATVDSLISVAITVCLSILVGFVFSHWISRDIKRITSDLKQLTEFHFSSVYKGRNNSVNTSNVKEIFEIQSAFHSMVTAFAKTLATNQSLLKGSVISSPTSLGATELNE